MNHRARQINQTDFEKFDLIFVMDQKNLTDVSSLCPAEHKSKIKMLTDLRVSQNYDMVPDPYYGGPQDFETVLDIVEDAWQGFLKTYFPSAKP